MRFFDNTRSSLLFSLGLFLPQLVILGIYFHKLYLKFISFCPNQNFLTWDPDARLVTSIRLAEAFRSFDPITVLRLTFDSPTWPVLRNFPEALIVLVFGAGGTPVSLFTFAELIVLFLIVPWILFRFNESKNWIVPLFLFPPIWAGLLQNPGFMHYSFSGMLEIQGGLFYLPAILSFWELQRSSVEGKNSYSPWFLCISVNLLFHTKYPYGYIFIFFGCLFLAAFRFGETKTLIFKILNSYGLFQNDFFSQKERSFKSRLSLALIPIFISIVFVILSFVLSKETLPGKSKAFLRYAGALIFWISISVTLWKIFYTLKLTNDDKESPPKVILSSDGSLFVWKNFWTYVILPIGSWVLLHPDRFSSSSSTIQHAQGAGLLPGQGDDSIFSLTYFYEIVENSSYAPFGGWILCTALILGILFGTFRYKQTKKITASFFIFLSVLISILGLTLMTPNHQPRHIYHLYPALSIGIVLFCYEEFFAEKNRIFSVLLYSIFLIFTLGHWSWNNHSLWEKTNLCFSGVDRSLFFTADDAEEVFQKSVNRSSILWNQLPLEHHNRPDVTLSFYRAGFENRREVREKRKKEELEFLNADSSQSTLSSKLQPDWFLVAKTCEEIEGGSYKNSSEKESKFSKEVISFPIRGACIVKFIR
ncbi:hypothetical protein EHQ76_20215 [Leptospira barantonii]|uniref:Dolichyl-phosphate-mannose--protein mannosyltransferase n=1 Tax=Leptospira barantonii TaxID=2023184 RepID=A0A5F2AX66_9LEPT|nr:hypothetical protein [Leptospira barantonii]TGL92130.1 hypothetical protein EHQ76_20215 [Leptospira barantonii]